MTDERKEGQQLRFAGASCRSYRENPITETAPLRDVICKLICMIEEVSENTPVRFRGSWGMSDLMQATQDARFRILSSRGK